MNKSAFALVMISCLSLAIMPAVGDDYTLDIFGNANMDEVIDEDDITYVEGIIEGTNEATDLADANYDGQIDEDDIVQIELIIDGDEKELTIIDSADRVVTVKKPVETIVILSSDSAEAIKAIGAKDKAIGRTIHINDEVFFPEFSKLQSVGSCMAPDCEKILELQPDVVITYEFWRDPVNELEEKLEPADIAVACLDCYKPLELEEDVTKLGYVLDKRIEAEMFVDFFQSYLININERVEELSEDDKPRVYFEWYNDYHTHGNGSGGHQMVATAGGINIAADLPENGVVVDPEWIVEQNPDIILKAVSTSVSGGYAEDDPAEMISISEEIMSRPGFGDIEAVKKDRVYLIAPDINTQPAFFVGVTYMAKWFHPDLFEDMDPQAIHQEYLTRFQGLDYDLDEHGVFVYPPTEVS